MLISALAATEDTINEAINSVDDVGLYSPSLIYGEVDSFWTVTGIVALRGVVGEPVYAGFMANAELLCESPTGPKCWRVDSLSVGETSLAEAGQTLGPISLLTLSEPDSAFELDSSTGEGAEAGSEEAWAIPDEATSADETVVEVVEYEPDSNSEGPGQPSEALSMEVLTRRIQEILRELGYSPGLADGVIGPRTVSAILAYQRRNGLTPDGIPSEELLERLIASRVAPVKDVEE